MRKFILLYFLLLTGCGYVQRLETHYTGNLQSKCYKGIEYLQSDSGLALSVDANGNPRICQ